jgi:GDP-L-fucose synthase
MTAAPEVQIWGSGTPLREFLYVDDMAAACLHLMQLPAEDYARLGSAQSSHVNAGSGEEISIALLARLIACIVGFEGKLEFDASKPDGTPRKLLDSSKLRSTGWQPRVDLREGIQRTVQDYLATYSAAQVADAADAADDANHAGHAYRSQSLAEPHPLRT